MKTTRILFAALALFSAQIAQAQTLSFDNSTTIYLDQMYLSPVTSEITVSGNPGATITSPEALAMFSIVIEQSNMESLEIWVECPNGSQAVLINSYAGQWEAIPGGIVPETWAGTYLGDPTLEDVEGTPGIGWEYTFSTTQNTWGDMATELVNENFVPATEFGEGGNSMNPDGVYQPYSTFDDLVGCPVDGVWTLHIQDNVDFNNGTFFGWGVDIDLGSKVMDVATAVPSIKAFPNPTGSTLNITVPNELSGERYVILNELGSVVMQGRVNGLTHLIDVANLDAGVYFVRVGDGAQHTVRFLKE